MIESMKQYHFDRSKFCDVFIRTFGEKDTTDFINGMFGTKKDHSTGCSHYKGNFD